MRMNVISELATMRALREGGMKVPTVWLPDLSEECELDSEYMFSFRDWEAVTHLLLVDDATGVHWYFVQRIAGAPDKRLMDTRPPAPSKSMLRIIYNVALSYLELEKTTFDSVGSPTLGPDGKVVVGPVIDWFPMFTSEPYYAGPFQTPRDRYVDHFQ